MSSHLASPNNCVIYTPGRARGEQDTSAWARSMYRYGRTAVVGDLRDRSSELRDGLPSLRGRRRRQLRRDLDLVDGSVADLDQSFPLLSEREAAARVARAYAALSSWQLIRLDTARVQRMLLATLDGQRGQPCVARVFSSHSQGYDEPMSSHEGRDDAPEKRLRIGAVIVLSFVGAVLFCAGATWLLSAVYHLSAGDGRHAGWNQVVIGAFAGVAIAAFAIPAGIAQGKRDRISRGRR